MLVLTLTVTMYEKTDDDSWKSWKELKNSLQNSIQKILTKKATVLVPF